MRFDSVDRSGMHVGLLTSGSEYQREYRVSTDDGLWATYEPKGRQPSQRTALHCRTHVTTRSKAVVSTALPYSRNHSQQGGGQHCTAVLT